MFTVQLAQHSQRQWQHHGGGGGVADPHGQPGRYRKQQKDSNRQPAAGKVQHLRGNGFIQSLRAEGRGQGKTTQKQENNGVGKTAEGFAGGEYVQQDRQYWHQQRRDADVNSLGQPQHGNKNQHAEACDHLRLKRQQDQQGNQQQYIDCQNDPYAAA